MSVFGVLRRIERQRRLPLAFALLMCGACGERAILVGVADPNVDAPYNPPVADLEPAVPGPNPATKRCPSRPDVGERLAVIEAPYELTKFAATDEHLAYATEARNANGIISTTLWHASSGQPPVILDEVLSGWRGSILIDDDRTYWSPVGVRSAFLRTEIAPASLLNDLSFAIHRLGRADVLVSTVSGGRRIRDNAPPALVTWPNPPDDDPAAWTMTARHAYWVSNQALYRANIATMAQESVLPGPISGGITSDETRVYWVEVRDGITKLRALDDVVSDRDPTTLIESSESIWPRALRATRSSVFVLSTNPTPSAIYRFDLKDRRMAEVLMDVSPFGLDFVPVLTACSVVYKVENALWRRPLPQP